MINEDRPPSDIAESEERRKKKRFRVDQEVLYKALYRQSVRQAGVGRVMDISSSGVCFTTQHALEPGMSVELSIDWPVLLSDSCHIKLMIQGRVVRSSAEVAVLMIERYEFRTQGSSHLHQLIQTARTERLTDGVGDRASD